MTNTATTITEADPSEYISFSQQDSGARALYHTLTGDIWLAVGDPIANMLLAQFVTSNGRPVIQTQNVFFIKSTDIDDYSRATGADDLLEARDRFCKHILELVLKDVAI